MSSTSPDSPAKVGQADPPPDPAKAADDIAEFCLRQAGLEAAGAAAAGSPSLDALRAALAEPRAIRRAQEPARAASALLSAALAQLAAIEELAADIRRTAATRLCERVCAALTMPPATTAALRQAAVTGGHSDRNQGALAAIEGLIENGNPMSCFGVVFLEIEPNRVIARLPTQAYNDIREAVTAALRKRVRLADLLFAPSGLTWIILLPGLVSPAQLTLAAVKFTKGLEELDLTWQGAEIPLAPRMGGAFYPDSGDNAHTLLQIARLARFDAAKAGEQFLLGNDIEIGNERHIAELTAEIAHALRSNQMALYLQPQVMIDSGQCHAAEALLRWRRPDGNWVPPPLIIRAVELAGLRPRFNRWLLQRALRHLTELGDAGIDINLGVNLVADDAQDDELPDMVRQALETWDVDPGRLVLEMTEGSMVAETDRVIENLDRLNALGLRLSIDDFGTGYSAMSYLRRLPLQELKVDQVFIRRMLDGNEDREIVASIIQLAHQLGMQVVAEGVETELQLDALRELGCDCAQGYLFSQPLSLTDFKIWWRAAGPV